MSPRKAGFLQIATSLAFAFAMLVASYLMGDSPHSQTVVLLLVAAWWIPFSYLLSAAQGFSICCELAWIGKKVRSAFDRD